MLGVDQHDSGFDMTFVVLMFQSQTPSETISDETGHVTARAAMADDSSRPAPSHAPEACQNGERVTNDRGVKRAASEDANDRPERKRKTDSSEDIFEARAAMKCTTSHENHFNQAEASQDAERVTNNGAVKRAASEDLDGPPEHKRRKNSSDDVDALEAAYQSAESNAVSEIDNTNVKCLPRPDETATPADATNGEQAAPPMSKSQQKKLRKKQEWEARRDERKVIRKEKVVAKRERRKAERMQQVEENGGQPLPAPVKKVKAQGPVTLPVTILIDCDFDDLMRDKELISLAAQITRSYSDNKNSMFRAHLTICSFGGKLRSRFENVLTHYKSWRGVRFLDGDFVEATKSAKEWMLEGEKGGKLAGVFSKVAEEDEEAQAKLKAQGEVVYLTSEADETLTELKPYSTYIIGGLVDKNREKGVCYKRATKRGIKTARLPIGEFMDMQSRKVLATNHVNEIMLKWLECGDWGEAFVKVIPKRKGGRLKTGTKNEELDGEQGDAEEADDVVDGVLDAEGGSDEPRGTDHEDAEASKPLGDG